MVASFKDADAQRLFETGRGKRIPATLRGVTIKKLQMLDAAVDLADLALPPGNRLEALKGDRSGQYSIRVNDQFRICFLWKDGNAHDVAFMEYR